MGSTPVVVDSLQTLSLGWAGGGGGLLEAARGASIVRPPTSDPPVTAPWLQALWAPVQRIFCLSSEPSRWRTPWSSCPRWLPMLAATTCRQLTTRTETTRRASPSLLLWRVSKPGTRDHHRAETRRVIKSQEWGSRGLLGRQSSKGC